MNARPAATILAALTGAWIGANVDMVRRMDANIGDGNLVIGFLLAVGTILQYRPLDPLSTEALRRVADRKWPGSDLSP